MKLNICDSESNLINREFYRYLKKSISELIKERDNLKYVSEKSVSHRMKLLRSLNAKINALEAAYWTHRYIVLGVKKKAPV